MPQYIEVGGVFASYEGGERDISHYIHHTGSSVGTGNPYRQCAVDDGEEDEPLAYSPELLGQGVIGISASRGKCCHIPGAPSNGAGIGHEDVKDAHNK